MNRWWSHGRAGVAMKGMEQPVYVLTDEDNGRLLRLVPKR
jgi:hypothetical protein